MLYYRVFSKVFEMAGEKMARDCQGFVENGSKILDLGCGSGIVSKKFENFFGAKVFGVDIQDKRIVNLPFKIIDGKNLPFPENYFDYILISYVLHHAENPIALLKEAKRVAKSKILVYEDLPDKFLSKIVCQLHSITFSYFFQNNRKGGDFKNDKEWKEIFEQLGLKLIFEKGVSSVFNPVNKKLFVLEKI